MDNIEEKFYKTFGIDFRINGCRTSYYDFYKGFRYSCDAVNCKKCKSAKRVYPTITDKILLMLIELHNKNCLSYFLRICVIADFNESYKNDILNEIINTYKHNNYKLNKKQFKEQVRSLFEGVEE